MVHRRIPKKNRKKLKSVDPFNRTTNALVETAQKRKNMEPVTDDQPLTKRQKEIQQLQESVREKSGTFPKKSRIRDRVLAEYLKGGFQPRNFVSTAHLLSQVNTQTKDEVHEKCLLAKYGLAGRDVKAIAADYAELDRREKERKKMKTAHRRKLLNKKRNRILKSSNKIPVVEDDEQKDFLSNQGKDALGDKAANKKRLTKKERLKKKRKEQRLTEEKEMMLNARELIPFGARVDAPPDLSSLEVSKSTSVNRPGTKSLLLKNMLVTDKQATTIPGRSNVTSLKRASDLAVERERVIEAYRQLKRTKLKGMC